jgi:hypothetical protein
MIEEYGKGEFDEVAGAEADGVFERQEGAEKVGPP